MKLLTTHEVAELLNVNEKVIYALVAEKGLPGNKYTGKWLFPQHLVEQWLKRQSFNFSGQVPAASPIQDLLVIAGNNDLLLDRLVSLFNSMYPEHVAVYGNIGGMGGINALRKGFCHIATALHSGEDGDTLSYATSGGASRAVVINFCRREQGLIIAKGNPLKLSTVADLVRRGLRMVNRQLGSVTRRLIDRELSKAGIKVGSIEGYSKEMERHFDVGLEIMSGRADVGPGIRAVASALDLAFIPLCWEQFDFIIPHARPNVNRTIVAGYRSSNSYSCNRSSREPVEWAFSQRG